MKSATPSRPVVWGFLSSREYVTAFDAWARSQLRGYSRRSFARWAGYASPNALTMIISGARRFSSTWAPGFVKAAKLQKDEAVYLFLLLKWEACSDAQEREHLLSELQRYVLAHQSTGLVGDTLNVLRNPLCWTLYHMMDLKGQVTSPRWFKGRLFQKVAAPLIQEALESLERMGLITKSGARYQTRSTYLDSPDELKAGQNREFHRYVLGEAQEVLDGLPPEARSFGSLTVAVSHERVAELKAEIGRFGRLLQKKYGTPGPVDGELYRMNIQLYPLTQTEPKP